MGQFWVATAVVAFFAVLMCALFWLGSRVRSRGRGSGSEGFMGPFEDMWHPAAHRARSEVRAVEERVVPIPSPDDWTGRRS